MVAAFNRFRLFHWLFATLFLVAYLTGDDGELLHVWLGYGLILVLALRFMLAPFKPRGFPKLAPARREWRPPSWGGVGKWLTFATLVSVTIASVLGLGLVDNGEVLSAALPGVSTQVFGAHNWLGGLGDLEDVHEFFANLALWLVGLHVGYVLLFRSKSVLPMLRGLPREVGERLHLLRPAGETDLLWCVEEALRAAPVGLVVAEPAKPLSLTAGRRFQLAAEAGNTTGLMLIREGAGSNATETRWLCEPMAGAMGSTLHRWSLIKNKRGTTGSWILGWNGETAAVDMVSALGERHEPEAPAR